MVKDRLRFSQDADMAAHFQGWNLLVVRALLFMEPALFIDNVDTRQG